MKEANKPLEVTLEQLKYKLTVPNSEYRYINPDFGIVISSSKVDSPSIKVDQPYRAKEGRIIRCLHGKAHVSINLIEYDIVPQMVIAAPPDSIIRIIGYSPDYEFQMIAANSSFLPVLRKEDLADAYIQQGFAIRPTDKEWDEIGTYFSLIWATVQKPVFRREVVQYLFTALLYNIKYIHKELRNSTGQVPSRQEELFHRFIALVNQHSKEYRTVGFYADKLCLTPRYLNTVIRQVSQHTVMEWIDRAVILEAQVLLKHGNLLVYQIADRLHFPNSSFFCKFFKRKTGMTPQEYQKK